MFKNRRFLALIPARGGSKRLPNKNSIELGGKPLLAWTVEAALQSSYLDKVVFSSDDRQLMELAASLGAEVPFCRPTELASDSAGRAGVINHLLDFYAEADFDYLVYLQPTSPLRRAVDIDGAIEYLIAKEADAVVSVCPLEHPPQWSGALPADRSMVGFLDQSALQQRSQDLPSHYRLNGAIYICDIERFRQSGTVFLADNIFAYEMPTRSSVDIDTREDLELAEFYMTRDV